MITLRPIGNRVVVLPDPPQTKTKGGIILPTVAQNLSHCGVVKAAGPGLMNPDGSLQPMTVKVGDRVSYTKMVGIEINITGEPHITMKETEILAVIDEVVDVVVGGGKGFVEEQGNP
jgi:chaperonin GroES